MFSFFSKPVGTQLLFLDDGSFQFRKLAIKDGFLLEYEGSEPSRSWMQVLRLQKRFKGHGNIKPCLVTLSCERDILLDPFVQLRESEKPEKGPGIKKNFITAIASAACYKHEKHRTAMNLVDKLILFFGATMLLEVFILGIIVAQKGGK